MCCDFTNSASNIDRQFAIWQTLHPDVWFAKDDVPGATAPQQPFYSSQDHVYNSNDVVQWTKFGYQYSILQRQPNESDADYIKRIKTDLSNLYPNTSDHVQDPSNAGLMPDGEGLVASSPDEVPSPPPNELTAQQTDEFEHLEATQPSTNEVNDFAPVHEGGKVYPDFLINILYDR